MEEQNWGDRWSLICMKGKTLGALNLYLKIYNIWNLSILNVVVFDTPKKSWSESLASKLTCEDKVPAFPLSLFFNCPGSK